MRRRETNTELKSSLDFNKTTADRFTNAVASAFGSFTFLICCILFFVVWAVLNCHIVPNLKPFDPFPFQILEMLVSLFAIILSVSVLINQNRQGKIEKLQQQIEFEVNVRAEDEITKTLSMLHEIQHHLGIKDKGDKELEKMKESTDIHEIHKRIDDGESSA
ncbi:DUF1003 domain-containing protein [Mucilaginibacter sp. dw_454]|uniref:DUF1003 domain-containing protein n=1 Tax=Mucilaginibacter sp. dw_454 TaxID=2720079 RepID=UPI001BD4A1B2|nr:DUF1003 domain-containing protein [Mucilaginibacter sp. dw_454]